MSINICKECGKQFEAKSPRILYCSAVHYRPCPVCGEPVVAKYLSDPPRRCEKCKNVKAEPVKQTQVSTSMISSISDDRKTYKGPKILGFMPGHQYSIEYKWNGWSAYIVNALYDFTSDKSVDLTIHLSNQKSIDSYFA